MQEIDAIIAYVAKKHDDKEEIFVTLYMASRKNELTEGTEKFLAKIPKDNPLYKDKTKINSLKAELDKKDSEIKKLKRQLTALQENSSPKRTSINPASSCGRQSSLFTHKRKPFPDATQDFHFPKKQKADPKEVNEPDQTTENTP